MIRVLDSIHAVDPAQAKADGFTAFMGYLVGNYPLTAAEVSAGVLFVMNGYLFQATAAGTSATNFIGWAAFNTTEFGNTTDGTITWQCLGKAGLMRFSFANVSASSQSVSAQDYEFFQA